MSSPPDSTRVVDEKRILSPGTTCWRTEHADRFAVIIDAADYFAAAKTAMLEAQHSIYLIGWDFDLRIRLEPGTEDDERSDDVPDELGHFLGELIRRRKGLRVYILKWDIALLWTFLRQVLPMLLVQWWRHPRIHFRLDSAHPTGAAHHQKILVIDDVLAFCGGIDMTTDRWDTRDHTPADERRMEPGGEDAGPWHDATAIVDGEAARALGELARQRWLRATGQRLRAPAARSAIWPENITPLLEDIDVSIARTAPTLHRRAAVHEIEQLCEAAIGAARRTIYIESQYFASVKVQDALARRLEEEDGPEVIVINPVEAQGWLEEQALGSARNQVLARLDQADRYDRFRIYYPVNADDEPIYVHAKVLVIDDRLLRVGSSNLNNRSMGFDTECDIAVEAVDGAPDEERVHAAVRHVRDGLLAEHLGVPREELERKIEAHGSVVRAIDALRKPNGRTLKPLEREDLNAAETLMTETHVFDPERPGQGESRVKHFAKRAFLRVPPTVWLGAGAVALVALVLGILRGRK